MATKKKYLWFLIISILAVVVIGTGTVTYAWFLSLYSSEYEFELDSDSRVILRYESELAFHSGTIDTAGNKIIIAEAKSSATGLNSSAATTVCTDLDMFDTSKVRTSAQAAHYTAKGAYWVGQSVTPGPLTFSLSAFVNGGDNTYDLVEYQEISYFVIFHYLSKEILYYHGQFYMNDTEDPTLTLPAIVGRSTLRYWRALESTDTVSYNAGNVVHSLTTDGTQLLLAPNSEFTYDLYVFSAKTDEDDLMSNGKRLDLSATISVE